MTTSKRFVLDTNTIVSALLVGNSLPRQALDYAFDHGSVLVSTPTLAELADVLSRTRFDRYVTLERRLQFLAAYTQNTALISITEIITDCRDPKDNKFLEVAVCGSADVIITGDRDLLDLHPYRGIMIMAPRNVLMMP
jgi:uncharacterized protein